MPLFADSCCLCRCRISLACAVRILGGGIWPEYLRQCSTAVASVGRRACSQHVELWRETTWRGLPVLLQKASERAWLSQCIPMAIGNACESRTRCSAGSVGVAQYFIPHSQVRRLWFVVCHSDLALEAGARQSKCSSRRGTSACFVEHSTCCGSRIACWRAQVADKGISSDVKPNSSFTSGKLFGAWPCPHGNTWQLNSPFSFS